MDRRSTLIPALVAGALAAFATAAMAADAAAPAPAGPPNPYIIPFTYLGPAPAAPASPVDPNYTVKALDNLGDSFFDRLVNYYKLEWGHDGAPVDPNAPASRRPAPWPPAPLTQPPYPFTEYSYGGTTSLGVNRPNSVDSPLMVALANTSLGKWMNDSNIQAYGWLNGGFNVSNEKVEGGNWPAAYSYRPNKLSLDQLVLYVERTPDTVQQDHFDWGFRVSGIYGQDYRYTTSFGYTSNSLYSHDTINGFDYPMMWLEGYIPWVAQGMMIRVGRYISIPDIEAQLAPNNYMFSHSMTYGYDNYTNTGIMTSTAVTKNFFVQAGVSIGTDTAFWHWGEQRVNPLYNQTLASQGLSGSGTFGSNGLVGQNMWVDPGAVPSFAGCLKYESDSAYDNIYLCMDGINAGQWGYNNLQWYGGTYYHKFNEEWHISVESYVTHQHGVLNISNVGQPGEANATALAIYNGGGVFSSPQYFTYNGPFGANCHNPNVVTCTTTEQTALAYLNYRWSSLDNISWRAEYVNDINGQRTGTATNYMGLAIGWQHWFSPQVEVRPEMAYYHSFEAPAFNGNANFGIAPTSNTAWIGSADIIWHF